MADEILASLDDINTHLPSDKARIDDADDNLLQIDAARYIRSLLAGFFDAATLVSWDTPANTPDLIRGVAGRIIAAKYYATLYSEDTTETSAFAQSLYNEANLMIDDIRLGRRVVLDANEAPIPIVSAGLSDTMFWPNDSTSGPVVTMDMRLG